MTRTNADYAALEKGLKAFFAHQFSDLEIVAVTIDDDIDLGDERILEISVVFEGTAQEMVHDRPVGLNSRLEDELAHLDFRAFPVLNFVPCSLS